MTAPKYRMAPDLIERAWKAYRDNYLRSRATDLHRETFFTAAMTMWAITREGYLTCKTEPEIVQFVTAVEAEIEQLRPRVGCIIHPRSLRSHPPESLN